MSRNLVGGVLFAVIALIVIVAVTSIGRASASEPSPLERVGGDSQFWRYHDAEHRNTCYLWGGNGIFCVADHP